MALHCPNDLCLKKYRSYTAFFYLKKKKRAKRHYTFFSVKTLSCKKRSSEVWIFFFQLTAFQLILNHHYKKEIVHLQIQTSISACFPKSFKNTFKFKFSIILKLG